MWSRKAALSAAIVAVLATACVHPNQVASDDSISSAPIGVQIQNMNFLDVDVFAISGGMAHRLGMVTGTSTGTFSLDPSYSTRPLYIVATPIGGRGRASSGELNVTAGDTVALTISPGALR